MYNRSLPDYLPGALRGVREFKAIMAAAEPEIAMLYDGIGDALKDQFVLTSTENGVSRREKIYGIVPKATLTLDERKFTILTRMAEQLPYTFRALCKMLAQLCGADGFALVLDRANYSISALVALTAANNVGDVESLLRRVCPANMAISVAIQYNQHYKLKAFTHAGMAMKTHRQLRNEVILDG